METTNARGTLVATSFGLGMALLDVTAGNVAVPSIQRDLGTGMAGLSWVIDGYTLTFASALLLAGGLGDRLGARRVFASGLVLFTLASLLCGVAPTIGLLIAARALQGLGAALFMPSSLALLARAYPEPKERARAIGFWSALTAIAGGSGPLVGGVLTSTLGWRSIFLVNLPLGIAGLLLTARFVRPTPAA
ncbi:MAG TPA: MFS transporter, partial [Myxococcaceae bacterium]|nr:MFS transporter [Myxococcaceae bacterium]